MFLNIVCSFIESVSTEQDLIGLLFYIIFIYIFLYISCNVFFFFVVVFLFLFVVFLI